MERIDFQKDYDVIVIGGGVAGVAAALAAAGSGAETALIERSGWLGGLATGGCIFFYLPLCDGRGTQVSFGLSEKLLHASVKYGPSMPLDRWKTDSRNYRYRTTFSPASFILAMEEMLIGAGVKIWYHTLFMSLLESTPEHSSLMVRNKGGNGRLNCKVIVDATGDAEVARESSCGFVTGKNNLAFWGIEHDRKDLDAPTALSHSLHGVIKGKISNENLPYHALDPRGESDFLLDSREWLRSIYTGNGTEVSKRFPVLIPILPDFRTSARIKGKTVIPHGTHNRPFPDSIGMAADWSSVGTVQEIPYSALLPENDSGIIVAGRCISAEGYSWDLIRSIPAVAVSGEAAGTAAALAVKNKLSPRNLPVELLQNILYARGCKLHLPEVGLPYMGQEGYIPSTLKFETH